MEVEGFRVLFKTIRYALFLFDKSARNLTWRINGVKKININVRKKGCINRSCPSDVFCKKSCTEFFLENSEETTSTVVSFFIKL